ncbi:CRAL-TRIO domain-containing protein [Phycomyces nitens]|nr:CRAL-TRIO domain-containing protein [Phycomyces nitens]
MLSIPKELAALNNSLYVENQPLIVRLEARLLQDIRLLDLGSVELANVTNYVRDRVTLFRFLYDSDFVEDLARERVLDTIQWRIQTGIDNLTWNSLANEFYNGNGFAFFHKHDQVGRPVAVIRMRYFPQFTDKSKNLSAYMHPFACFVMEMARKITWQSTQEREAGHHETPLVSQIVVIIDIAKAPFIAVDSQLITTLKDITNTRFPGFIGSVYVMNFGWMYQGVWQMVKLLLTEQAKSKVNFPSSKQVQEVISKDHLLKELGGEDDFEWSLETDVALQSHGCGQPLITPPSPPLPPQQDRSRSSSVSSTMSDETFFDAKDYTSGTSSNYQTPYSDMRSVSSSVYGTPGTLTPLPMPTLCDMPWSVSSNVVPQHVQPTYHWNGLHMGEAFLTSFLNKGRIKSNGISALALANRLAMVEQEQMRQLGDDDFINDQDILIDFQVVPHFPHLLPPNNPQSSYASSPVRMHLLRSEQRALRMARQLFRLTFRYNGALYWVLLYIFLRGPVEQSVRKALARILAQSPQKIAYTTIGITATMAAAMGASLSATLNQRDSY